MLKPAASLSTYEYYQLLKPLIWQTIVAPLQKLAYENGLELVFVLGGSTIVSLEHDQPISDLDYYFGFKKKKKRIDFHEFKGIMNKFNLPERCLLRAYDGDKYGYTVFLDDPSISVDLTPIDKNFQPSPLTICRLYRNFNKNDSYYGSLNSSNKCNANHTLTFQEYYSNFFAVIGHAKSLFFCSCILNLN